MNQFDKLTIKQKLFIPSVLVIAGFLGLALIYLYEANLRDRAEAEAVRITDFFNSVNELYEQTLEHVVSEKEYLLRGGEKGAELLLADAEPLMSAAGALLAEAPTAGLRSEVEEMERHINNYLSSMRRMIDAKFVVGMDENLGLLTRQ